MKDQQEALPIFRIAPTPSGYLHTGNAFSFVLTWLLCRKMGGKLILRIDDSDSTRSRAEYIEDIFYTLDWLGLDYELGPEGPDDFAKHFSQQKRIGLYESFLNELLEIPALVYSCSCSRKEIQQLTQGVIYPGTCRSKMLPFNRKNISWRIYVPEQMEVSFKEWSTGKLETLYLGKQMGDFVIRRKDGLPSYQIVSLVDDIYFGVNFIVRGNDLFESTAAQLYLARCLGSRASGAKSFLHTEFYHHPLLLDPEGQKLSKSKGSVSVHMMREAGKKPCEVYKMVAGFCGTTVENAITLPDLLKAFEPDMLKRKG